MFKVLKEKLLRVKNSAPSNAILPKLRRNSLFQTSKNMEFVTTWPALQEMLKRVLDLEAKEQ